MPRAFSPDEKEAIRKALLERGRALFARHGLRRTSVRQLTRAAGISQGAFYAFYPSKEELFFEILEAEERDFGRAIAADLGSGRLGRRRVTEILRSGVDDFRANPLLGSLLASGEYEHLRRSIPEARMRRHLEGEEQFMAEVVRLLRRGGGSKRIDPKRIVSLLQAIFLLYIHEDEFDRESFPWLIDRLCELAVDQVLPPASRGSP